jgi:hypothetical protein
LLEDRCRPLKEFPDTAEELLAGFQLELVFMFVLKFQLAFVLSLAFKLEFRLAGRFAFAQQTADNVAQ